MIDLDRRWQVIYSEALEALKLLPDACVHAVVTDCPYGIGSREPKPEEIIAYLLGTSDLNTGGDFMKRNWKVPSVAVWKECLRVLKPGGYLATFSGARTFDLIGMGIRMAGFRIVDSLDYIYGSGMPHALNVSKAIDKRDEVTHLREVVHTYQASGNAGTSTKEKGGTYGVRAKNSAPVKLTVTKGATEKSRAWDGFLTNLKPAREPIILAQRPFKGLVAENCLEHGVGALNIDACRIATDWNEPDRPESWRNSGHSAKPGAEKIAAPPGKGINCHPSGRYPPNVLFQHSEGCRVVGTKRIAGDERGQCNGKRPGGFGDVGAELGDGKPNGRVYGSAERPIWECADDCPVAELERQAPGVSKFFPEFCYSSKASTRERDEGLPDGFENRHTTVKKIAVVRWLMRLVVPRQGCLVLDPFCGSGSHGIAAIQEGFRFLGIEKKNTRAEPWVTVARRRIAHAERMIAA